jgi:predicted aspartyl protease
MNKTTLEMDLFTGLPMVYIELWNKKKSSYSDLLITLDTRASVTTISADILLRAGHDISSGRINRVTTASGVVYVRELVIDKIRLGTIELNDVLVYAHTFPQESFSSGVLGLNVLSTFDVNFQFSKGLLTLEK